MFWYSRLTEHAGYAGQLLGRSLVSSFGLGLVFVPLSLVALHSVAEQDTGVASSLLNAAQQVGGAIGLARAEAGHAPPASIYDHALTIGFSRGFLVAAGIGLLAVLIAIATIRIRRQDLPGAAEVAGERNSVRQSECRNRQ